MQVPLGSVHHAVAEQPEAGAIIVLDAIVVAYRRHDVGGYYLAVGAWMPPFVGDPLRTLHAHDPVGVAMPLELPRRIVGDHRGDAHFLGALQQPYRPRSLHRGEAGPGTLRYRRGKGNGHLRARRQMAVVRCEAD